MVPSSHFLKIHFYIILPFTPRPLEWALSLRCILLLSPIHSTCPAHLILFDLITQIIFGDEYRSLSSSICRFLHSPVTLSLLSPNILLSTLFSNTLSLRSSLNVSNRASHPYKTTGKIRVPYILIFLSLDSKLEDRRFSTE